MLAEPRRRQKWSSDPRGASWSNDDSKFGQKMLEKMGWQKGKGLGAKEDGMTQHVKASLKFDQTGLGCSTDQAENWISHQDDFDALLAGLNASHGTTGNGETESSTKTISIEEKSKSSKRRVHYHKFTRGKDLSSMSQADLACIMGKKASQSEPVTPNQSEPATPRSQSDDEDEDSAASCPPLDTSNNYGVTTITKSQSIQDYFAQKMAEIKKLRSGGEVESQDGDAKGESSEFQVESSSERKSKKKSKKRKYKEQEDVSSESEEVKESSSIRKKKKREHKEENNELAEMEVTSQGDSQKDKKKKKRKKEKELEVLEQQQEVLEELESSKEKRKKKKKSRNTVESLEDMTQSVTCETVEESSSKSKKKKKKSKKEKLQDD